MSEDSKSENSSNGSSFVDVNRSILDVYIDISTDKNAWKKDKKCYICKSKFGNKLSLINDKRFRCKFCWRGVCGKCTPTRARHPDYEKPQRICNACFQRSKENKISESYSIELDKARNERDDLEIRLELEKRENETQTKERKALEEKYEQAEKEAAQRVTEQKQAVDSLRSQRDEIAKKYSSLKNQIVEAEQESKQRTQVYLEIEQELKSLKASKNCDRDELGVLRNELAERQDENVRLLRLLDEKRAPPLDESPKQRKRREKEEKLKAEIEMLSEQHREIQDENRGVAQEIVGIDTELQGIDFKIQKIKENNQDKLVHPTRGSMAIDEEERIRELKSIIQDQQKQIDKLRADLGRYKRTMVAEDREMSSADV